LIKAFPQIVVALLKALVIELPKAVPDIIAALFNAVVQLAKDVLNAIADAVKALFTGIFRKDSDGDGVRDGKDSDPDDPSVAYSGVKHVPATMRMTVHEGEAIVPANRNPQRGGGGMDPALAGAQAFLGNGGGGAGRWAINVMLGGRTVDTVLVDAKAKGQTPGLTRILRKNADAPVGYSSGRFSDWNK
jgi:hypothetical protein